MIKRILVLLLILLSFAHSQEEAKKIILKVGKHKDFNRFVFICNNQDIVNSINVTLMKDGKIKLLFPDIFDFQFEDRILQTEDKIKDINIKLKNNTLLIETLNIKEIKVLKLDSPPRLVVDAYYEEDLTTKPIIKTHIIIDPGHGGRDSGIKNKDISEKNIVLGISKDIALKLAKRDIKVSLTRASDEDITLLRRIRIGNDLKPLIFLSLHLSTEDSFILYRSPLKRRISKDISQIHKKEEEFIEIITKRINEKFQEPVVVEKIPLSILKELSCPSILIELPKRTIIDDVSYRDKIVEVVSEVIIDYTKSVEKK